MVASLSGPCGVEVINVRVSIEMSNGLRRRIAHGTFSFIRIFARESFPPKRMLRMLAQPALKALATQRPGFPVAVDDEIGKAGAIACVKELGGRCDMEEDVRAAHGARPSSARPWAP
jgi:hypothetical protein